MIRITRLFLCVILTSLAIGCGGGSSESGGDSGGGGGGGSGGGGGAPPGPPDLIAPTYAGSTDIAPVTPETARHLAAGALAMHDVFEFFATAGFRRFWSQWALGEVHAGADGGTGRVVERDALDSTHWATYEFDGFMQAGTGLHGTLLEIRDSNSLRYSFDGLEMTTLGIPLRLRGHVDLTASGDVFWGTLRLTVSGGGRTWFTETLTQPDSSPTNGRRLELAGRLYDAELGFVTLTSDAAIEYKPYTETRRTATFPFRGALTLHGQTSAQLALLNPHYHSLEFPAGTGGSAGPVTQRYTAQMLRTGAALPTGLEADAGPPAGVTTGGPVIVDGRFSSAGSGLVRYQWSLIHGPPGAAPLDGPTDHPTMTIPGGVDGDYLFALRVTDGADEAFDEVKIRVSEFGGTGLPTRWGGPSREVAVGERVTVPRHRYLPPADVRPWDPPSVGFLETPSGSAAELEESNPDYPSFTPDIAGGYLFLADSVGLRAARISAGTPLQPTPHVQIISRFSVTGFAVADVNADGLPDIVTTYVPPSPASGVGPSVLLYRRLAGGVFAPAQMADPAGAYSVVPVAFPASGRTGLVAILDDKVKPLIQAADGSFAAGTPVVLPAPDMSGTKAQFAVADFFGRGLPSIVVVHDGYDDLIAIDVQADDTLATPRILPVDGKPAALRSFHLAGAPFLAVQHATGGGTDRFMSVFSGKPDGTLDERERITAGLWPNNFTVADLGAGAGVELFIAGDHALRRYAIAADGTLSQQQAITLGGGAHSASLLVGDFIGEGRKQVLLDRSGWMLHRTAPGGELDDGVPWNPAGRNLTESLAADMDDDGIDDIVTRSSAALIEYGRRAGR